MKLRTVQDLYTAVPKEQTVQLWQIAFASAICQKGTRYPKGFRAAQAPPGAAIDFRLEFPLF
jgi:hypothetical protein